MNSIFRSKKIILLGELNHGDGTSFLTKTALVKYLHEELNFNTLAFEASYINCNFFWNRLNRDIDVFDLSKETIYYIWSEISETRELFRYIQEQKVKGTPLKIVGIDPQFSGRSNANLFIPKLEEKLVKIDSNIIHETDFKDFCYELRIQSEWLKYPQLMEHGITEEMFKRQIEKYENVLLPTLNQNEKKIWGMFFQNIRVMSSIKWTKENHPRRTSFGIRDKQMFLNLDYLHQLDTTEKCIVWAASAHIARKDGQLNGKGVNSSLIGVKKLGDYIFEKYKEKAYSIAFTAGSGRLLRLTTKSVLNVPNHNKNALEDQLKGQELVFVDLKKFESKTNAENYEAMLFYPGYKCSATWSNHYDGVVYIDQMKPSTPLW